MNEVADAPLLMEPIWPESCSSRLLAVVLGMALVFVAGEGMLSREILEIVGSATAVTKRGRLLKQVDALLLLHSQVYITEATRRMHRGRCLAPTFYRFHDLTSLAHLAHMKKPAEAFSRYLADSLTPAHTNLQQRFLHVTLAICLLIGHWERWGLIVMRLR